MVGWSWVMDAGLREIVRLRSKWEERAGRERKSDGEERERERERDGAIFSHPF